MLCLHAPVTHSNSLSFMPLPSIRVAGVHVPGRHDELQAQHLLCSVDAAAPVEFLFFWSFRL